MTGSTAEYDDDEMTGDGNDQYIVEDASDEVTELHGSGTDTVFYHAISLVARRMSRNMTFTGWADITGIGDQLSNAVEGDDSRTTCSAMTAMTPGRRPRPTV